MKYFIKVKTGARKEYVKKITETSYEIAVKERPYEGRATEAVIKAFAEYLDIPQSNITLVTGSRSAQKILEVL